MSPQQTRTADDQFRKAIGKLVRGLEKRDREQNNRRAHHRFHFGVKVSLCTKTGDDSYKELCNAWAVDLSVGGMGFMTEQDICDEDVLYVSFEKLIGKPCFIPVQIRHCRTLVGNVYMVNGQFVYPDDIKDLQLDLE
jgi:PilZ domain